MAAGADNETDGSFGLGNWRNLIKDLPMRKDAQGFIRQVLDEVPEAKEKADKHKITIPYMVIEVERVIYQTSSSLKWYKKLTGKGFGVHFKKMFLEQEEFYLMETTKETFLNDSVIIHSSSCVDEECPIAECGLLRKLFNNDKIMKQEEIVCLEIELSIYQMENHHKNHHSGMAIKDCCFCQLLESALEKMIKKIRLI